mmetsp:Transcript_33215/g.95836  ORF Transcript_33215/g.95836 Transcript_33215/m.95836 type:complete len:409 (+) Transcript_33215:420-1646(+)
MCPHCRAGACLCPHHSGARRSSCGCVGGTTAGRWWWCASDVGCPPAEPPVRHDKRPGHAECRSKALSGFSSRQRAPATSLRRLLSCSSQSASGRSLPLTLSIPASLWLTRRSSGIVASTSPWPALSSLGSTSWSAATPALPKPPRTSRTSPYEWKTVNSFAIRVAYLPSTEDSGVCCFSCAANLTIDGRAVGTTSRSFDSHVDPATGRPMRLFAMGLLGSNKRTAFTFWLPFKDKASFQGKETKVEDVQATLTIRQLPLRCLVLTCLRARILEAKWDDIQAIGSAIRRKVAEYMGLHLAHVKAPHVSPLRLLTHWFASRGRDAPLPPWLYEGIMQAAFEIEVLEAHRRDIPAFLRRVACLGDRGRLAAIAVHEYEEPQENEKRPYVALLGSIMDEELHEPLVKRARVD